MAAIWCAADHPDRLGGLILLEGLIAAQDIRLRRYELAVLRSNVTGWLVEGWIGRIIRVLSAHRDIADSGRAAAIAMTRSSVPFPPRETGTLLDEAAALNFSAPELTRIAVPTLIVHGDRDRTVPSGPAIQAALTMPAARLIMVRGGNHHSTIPSETARASMHGFIRGSSARYFASE